VEGGSGSIRYEQVDDAYFEQRGLRRYAGAWFSPPKNNSLSITKKRSRLNSRRGSSLVVQRQPIFFEYGEAGRISSPLGHVIILAAQGTF